MKKFRTNLYLTRLNLVYRIDSKSFSLENRQVYGMFHELENQLLKFTTIVKRSTKFFLKT
jgi:hypothetical protein